VAASHTSPDFDKTQAVALRRWPQRAESNRLPSVLASPSHRQLHQKPFVAEDVSGNLTRVNIITEQQTEEARLASNG